MLMKIDHAEHDIANANLNFVQNITSNIKTFSTVALLNS
jgi:hypothetical protein